MIENDFRDVELFENLISKFFGSKYAVAVDCCTHGLELCLRQQGIQEYTVPNRTYISVPLLANKLGIKFKWTEEDWQEYYYLGGTNIIDAAVLWRQNSYIPETFMCLSFQFKKHLSLGRGGMILTDDKESATQLKKMSYDGRVPYIPWGEQDITSVGYHYYMTPETAKKGIEKLPMAINTEPRKWSTSDWPDLRKMGVFK